MGFLIKPIFYCAILAVLFSFYGDDIARLVGNQMRLSEGADSKPIRSDANVVHSLEIPIKNDGHYWIDMNVNNNRVRFIVDTGASYVTLSHTDAEKLNLHLFENDYNVTVNTAAGRTTMAEVTLDTVSIGVIELYEVRAFVAREGMLAVSLLGMNYLNRLDRFEFRDQKLIIEQ
tara:strand:- start:278847 stop:279368 length:522 start_codon:yes stop_codon:yes gene_type:complete